MRLIDGAALTLGLLGTPAFAAGSPAHRIDLPGGPLGRAVTAIGEQAGISIGTIEPDLARQPVAPLSGRMTGEQAIKRLARQVGACVRAIDSESFRIERCPPGKAKRPNVPPQTTEASPDPIVVTASKRDTPRSDYAGTSILLDTTLAERSGLAGTAAIVARLPSLTATNLGPGRNKLFIRGIADSSFNGPTQATVGQYFGDTRLNYNAPDPDLMLYDVRRVEVLEGPQGTLYGAGSLGGIYRIVPESVDLAAIHGSAAAGGSTTAHGAPGWDVAGMLNLPVVTDRLGVRAIAYRSIEGGYIDDIQRGLSDINRTRIVGGRIAVQAKLPQDWSILATGVLQNIDSADGQYTEAGLPALERRSAVAQPFDNDYALGSLTLTKNWGSTRWTTVATATRHHVTASYDFTQPGATPQLFVQRNDIALFSGESRLSRTDRDGSGWVIGASLVYDDEKLIRTLGTVAAPQRIAGVRNTILDGAIFGEDSVRLSPSLLLTAGGRAALTRLGGEGLDQAPNATAEPSRRQLRFLPSLGLAWKPGWNAATIFARVQQGFRPGGLEVNDQAAVQEFQGDLITTWEVGARAGRDAVRRVTLEANLSYSRWNNIQADLVTSAGQPYTANIGSGRVIGAELRVGWRPWSGVALQGSAFANDSELVRAAPGFSGADASNLPNIPAIGAQGSVQYSHSLPNRWTLSADLSGRYVGHSRLGVGPLLNISQGNFFNVDGQVRLGTGRLGITLGLTNMLDSAANTFSLGDPYRVAQRLERTPLRPRTLRVGIDTAF